MGRQYPINSWGGKMCDGFPNCPRGWYFLSHPLEWIHEERGSIFQQNLGGVVKSILPCSQDFRRLFPTTTLILVENLCKVVINVDFLRAQTILGAISDTTKSHSSKYWVQKNRSNCRLAGSLKSDSVTNWNVKLTPHPPLISHLRLNQTSYQC